MEKIIEIICKQNTGNKEYSWSGKFICDNSKIKGIAYSEDKSQLFYLIGSFIEDNSIKFLKIPCNEDNKFNITRCTMAKCGEYYKGDVYKEGQFSSTRVGSCTAEISNLSFFVADQSSLSTNLNQARSAIDKLGGLGYFLLLDAEREQNSKNPKL